MIVAEERTQTNAELASAGLRRGVESAIVPSADLDARTRTGDTVLGRIDVLPTLDGVQSCVWDLRRLERSRMRILNPASALLAAHDKLMTALRLARSGVPHPRTAHVDNGASMPELALPVVVKPRFGSGGRDVVRCDTGAELEHCLEQLQRRRWFRRHGALVQELVPVSGNNLRLMICHGELVGAVERVLADEGWQTSVGTSDELQPVEPHEEAVTLAVQAASVIGGDLIGVDLAAVGDTYMVLELNAAVEFTSDYSFGGRNVFDHIAELLLVDWVSSTESAPAPSLS